MHGEKRRRSRRRIRSVEQLGGAPEQGRGGGGDGGACCGVEPRRRVRMAARPVRSGLLARNSGGEEDGDFSVLVRWDPPMCVRGPRQRQAVRECLEPDDLIANPPGDPQPFPFEIEHDSLRKPILKPAGLFCALELDHLGRFRPSFHES
jgi:hypothetical protein